MKLARFAPSWVTSFALGLLSLTPAAFPQDPAEHYTEGMVIADGQTRFETLRDVNGDGVLDAIGWYWVTNYIHQIRASVTLFDGEGGILSHTSRLSPDFGIHTNLDEASGSCVGDFDGNGVLEQLVLVYDLYVHMELRVDGTIHFFPTIPVPAPYWNGPSWSAQNYAVADFTGDGVDDFLAVNTQEIQLWSFESGSPTLLQTVPYGDYFQTTVVVGELTGDGAPDVAVSLLGWPNNFIRIYPIDGGRIGPEIEFVMEDAGGPLDLTLGDLDLDGDDDLALFGSTIVPTAGGTWENTSRVITQSSPGVFTVGPRQTESGPATDLADVNGDGFLDGICCGGSFGEYDVVNDDPSTFMVCLNDGAGGFSPSAPFPGLGAHHIAGAMDYDGDGDTDLIAGRVVLLNTQAVGTVGCASQPNSTGIGASLIATGSSSISRQDLLLTTNNLPAGIAGLTFFGLEEGLAPLGNGNICVSGTLHRLPVQVSNSDGCFSLPLDFGVSPGANLLVGDLIHVQTWYRDPGVGANSNLSSSERILVMP